MPSTASPFGFRPSKHASGYGTRGVTALPGGIVTGDTPAIYQHQPVTQNTSGTISATTSTNSLVGTFIGCEYDDANGRHVVSNQWVSGTTATNITAYFTDDPNIEYEIQCDGSLAQTSIGDTAYFSNLTANGSGISQCTISSTLSGATTARQLRIVGLSNDINNAWSDNYTTVRVRIANHQFVAQINAI